MKNHSAFVVLAAFAALTATIGAPSQAQAQGTGQIVQAVAKLNAAQMSLVKRLADDPGFARQFEATRGNSDAMAGLVSEATGVAKANIRAGSGGLGMAPEAGGAPRENGTVFRLARFERTVAAPASAMLSGKVCFDFGAVKGCFEF